MIIVGFIFKILIGKINERSWRPETNGKYYIKKYSNKDLLNLFVSGANITIFYRLMRSQNINNYIEMPRKLICEFSSVEVRALNVEDLMELCKINNDFVENICYEFDHAITNMFLEDLPSNIENIIPNQNTKQIILEAIEDIEKYLRIKNKSVYDIVDVYNVLDTYFHNFSFFNSSLNKISRIYKLLIEVSLEAKNYAKVKKI